MAPPVGAAGLQRRAAGAGAGKIRCLALEDALAVDAILEAGAAGIAALDPAAAVDAGSADGAGAVAAAGRSESRRVAGVDAAAADASGRRGAAQAGAGIFDADSVKAALARVAMHALAVVFRNAPDGALGAAGTAAVAGV